MKKLLLTLLLIPLLFCGSAFGTTRAVQLDILLSGLIDPNTLGPVAAGTVYFYEAGTSNTKNVWTEKEKTNPYTSYTLSAAGIAQLYGEGEYKIVVKDSDGSTLYTWDDVRLKYPNYYVHSITTDYTQTSADDLLLVDTTGGAVTISGLAAADWQAPLKIILINGTNTLTYDPDGSETIDGDSTKTITAGLTAEIVSDGSNLRSVGGATTSLIDTDQDTQVQVEETADEDIIRGDVGGDEKLYIGADATASYIQVNAVADEDNDTKVQVEESADEDKVRIDVANDEKLLISPDATESYIQVNALIDEDADTGVQVEESADEDTIRFNAGGSEIAYITSSGVFTAADREVGGAPTIANNANGNPNVSDTEFDVDAGITETTWESIGPTGGGAVNIWTAMDSIASDADWIRVQINASANDGAGGTDLSLLVYARKTGSTEAVGFDNRKLAAAQHSADDGDAYAISSVEATIPINANGNFDMQWDSNFTSQNIIMILSGWGYNKE